MSRRDESEPLRAEAAPIRVGAEADSAELGRSLRELLALRSSRDDVDGAVREMESKLGLPWEPVRVGLPEWAPDEVGRTTSLCDVVERDGGEYAADMDESDVAKVIARVSGKSEEGLVSSIEARTDGDDSMERSEMELDPESGDERNRE